MHIQYYLHELVSSPSASPGPLPVLRRPAEGVGDRPAVPVVAAEALQAGRLRREQRQQRGQRGQGREQPHQEIQRAGARVGLSRSPFKGALSPGFRVF